MSPDEVEKVHDYRYCFTRYGVMENEVCPIFTVVTDQLPHPNPDEVEHIRYEDRDIRLEELQNDPA